MSTVAIILAAGKGTRMKSELAKVLHEAAGRPRGAGQIDRVNAPMCTDVEHRFFRKIRKHLIHDEIFAAQDRIILFVVVRRCPLGETGHTGFFLDE